MQPLKYKDMHLVYRYLVHLISLNGDGNYQEDTDTQGNVGSNLSKWMNVKELKKHYTIKQLCNTKSTITIEIPNFYQFICES